MALHLARLFKQAGWRVLAAESMAYPLLSFSNAVERCFSLPGPNQDENGFIQGLVSLIQEYEVDWLIPTCEETFFISKHYRRLSSYCRVLVGEWDILQRFHHKGNFIADLQQAGEWVPKTTVIRHPQEWRRQVQNIPFPAILKPVYSRFGTQVRFLNKPSDEPPVSLKRGWVLQKRIAGSQICAYGVSQRGRLTAYSCYHLQFAAGIGSAITFCHAEEPEVFAWVKRFVKRHRYTGQISFDFIRSTEDGRLYPLECNPRTTSGVHLFTGEDLVQAMVGDPPFAIVTPDPRTKTMLALPFALYGWKKGNLRAWLTTFVTHRDVIFDWNDPKPFFGQAQSLRHLWKEARKQGVPLLQFTTRDIEWEGGETDGTGDGGDRISRTSLGTSSAPLGAGSNRIGAK
ncbi:putative ATP-grasp superfamily ATP-dependent carboligase [Desmospora activa DSM 45169]|uniref:Putative ATP-grasp superfamily ATP-dependent carboligase n=1 Tax=Desmospora activa DSM 45169 TaxID=1121389 RepID=A0A2T4ZD89_9BACL|nr:putative ATP-grasp superfamily ATP-dependent carboligase [Desmospora activa DSM 45169]